MKKLNIRRNVGTYTIKSVHYVQFQQYNRTQLSVNNVDNKPKRKIEHRSKLQ